MNFINSKTFSFLASILFVWILLSVISIKIENSVVKKKEESVENKIVEVQKNNRLLDKFLDYSGSAAFLEREARLRLNYKLPDEEVVFIHRDLNTNKASSSESFSVGKLLDYKKWWKLLSERGESNPRH